MHDPPPDIAKLPAEVREALAQLELELSEGDITEKGFKKKKEKLLMPYMGKKDIENGGSASPSTNAQRRRQRRLTRNESRYHSEIRQEAVLQALSQKSDKESKYVALQPLRRKKDSTSSSRRPSVQKLSDSSSDDDSTLDSDKTPVKAQPALQESNNNKKPMPRPRLLRHRSRSRDPHHHQGTPESPSGNGVSPMQRLLNEEQRLRKQNKRSSQIFGVEPPIVAAVANLSFKPDLPDIADRALPKPPEEDSVGEEVADDDAVYVNSGHCTSTNDSGLGSTTGVPPATDYANTRIPFRPTKVSSKIHKMVQNLQVSYMLSKCSQTWYSTASSKHCIH